MTQLFSQVLSLVLIYGYPIIVLSIFLSGFGIPLPLGSIIMAAGSFASDGSLNFWILLPLVALSATISDILVFYVGKYVGPYVLQKLTRFLRIRDTTMLRAEKSFSTYGFWWIFVTRWIFTFFALPVNLLAGSSEYPISKFIVAAAIGETIWASIYLTIGYYFGADWELVVQNLGSVPSILTLSVIGIGLLFIAVRFRKK